MSWIPLQLRLRLIDLIKEITNVKEVEKVDLIDLIEEITKIIVIKQIESVESIPNLVVEGSEGISLKQVPAGAGAGEWVSPTGFEDPGYEWSYEERAYDDDLNTYSLNLIAGKRWSRFLILTVPEMVSNKLRFYSVTALHLSQVDVDVFRDDEWINVYQGAFSDGWNIKEFGEGKVTKARIRFYNSSSGSIPGEVFEFDFWKVPSTGGELIVKQIGAITDAPSNQTITKLGFWEDADGKMKYIKYYSGETLLFTLTFSDAGEAASETWNITRS